MENTREILIIPGLWNSGPQNWQTIWQRKHPEYIRVQQRDWDHPICEEWIETLDKFVTNCVDQPILVAHSLGCATVAHWAVRYRRKVHAAFLVAPSDVDAPTYPSGTEGFNPMPLEPLGFPSMVVASSNDPYLSMERAQEFAAAWGSRFVNIGKAGHINPDSGYGEWPEGERLLRELL
jgi:hypothetical protein